MVFFDTPVCRAWVFAPSVQAFSEDSDANEAGSVSYSGILFECTGSLNQCDGIHATCTCTTSSPWNDNDVITCTLDMS